MKTVQQLRVVVASPGDVASERDALEPVIQDLTEALPGIAVSR